MVVKSTLLTTHIASLLLGASFNMIFATHLTSLLLGVLMFSSVTLSHQGPARRPKPVKQGVTIFTIHKPNDLNVVATEIYT